MTAAPRPLPASSPRLRHHRYQADVLGPRNHLSRKVTATGRFATIDDAKRWADEEHADAEVVNITLFSSRRGWQSQHCTQRIDGTWL